MQERASVLGGTAPSLNRQESDEVAAVRPAFFLTERVDACKNALPLEKVEASAGNVRREQNVFEELADKLVRLSNMGNHSRYGRGTQSKLSAPSCVQADDSHQ